MVHAEVSINSSATSPIACPSAAITVRPRRCPSETDQAGNLPAHGFFDVTDLLLHFAGNFFRLTFALEIRVVDDVPNCFLKGTLQFMRFAFDLVFDAFFHNFTPYPPALINAFPPVFVQAYLPRAGIASSIHA